MGNHSCGRKRPPSQGQPTAALRPACPEPEVRRWPHPTGGPEPQPPEAALHYLHCSLAYQNQLLAEIKTLLQELQAAQPWNREEK